jgi:hypothetical protein
MASGIFGSTVTALTNGTTANAADVLASLNSIRSNGMNNDGGALQTDGNGNMFGPNGQIRVMVFITPVQLLNSVAFTSGQVQLFTAWGQTGIPATGPVAILIGANTTSASTGQSAAFYPNGGTQGQYFSAGNVQVANGFANVFGILPLDGSGKFNVKSVNAAGTITVWCFGYVI